jgi:iron(III) transport system substrate-binding protein
MGLFRPVPKNIAAVIGKNNRAEDNTWIGLSARARVLVVNKKAKDQYKFVKSVADLADKRLRGKIAITHSANGSFISGLTVYQQTWGDEKTLTFLKGLKANSLGKTYNKHRAIVADVANGKKPIGLINHYYYFRHIKKHPDAQVELLLPDQGKKGMGVAWNIAGVALVKHGKKAKLAEQLVAFLVSKEGQSIFANVNQEFPVRKDVKPAKGIPQDIKVAPVPMSSLGKMRNKTLGLIEKVGL